MGIKSVCFECKKEATGVCSSSHPRWVVLTGSSFRPPKKTDVRSWKSLFELYTAQRIERQGEMKILYGFGGHAAWNTHYNPGVHKAPRSLRERCYINTLKEQARRPRNAF